MRIVLILLFFTIPVFAQTPDLLKAAESLMEQGKFNDADDLLRQGFGVKTENPRANYLLGVICLHKQDYEDAIHFLETAVSVEKDSGQYYFMLGSAFAMKISHSGMLSAYGAARDMKKYLEKALDLKPDHRDAMIMLFQFYLQAPGLIGGDKERAKELARDLTNIDPASGHYLLALFWEDEEDDAQTERELLLALGHDSTNVGLLNHIGYFYLRTRSPESGHPYFSRAISLAPKTANVYDSMGDYFAAVADYDSALQYYNTAIIRDPDFTVSIYNKAKMLEVLGKPSEALAVYRDLARRFPDDRYGKQAKERADELD